MKMKASVMVLALTAALAFGPALFAQTPASPTPETQSPTPQSPTPETTPLPDRNPEQQAPETQSGQQSTSSSASSQSMQGMKTFSGTIVKVSDKFVLQDTATNSKYDLDNQSTAKQYEGKQVVVTGSLDANSTLHVETIELAK